MITAKHAAEELIGRPSLAERFELGDSGGEWKPEARTVSLQESHAVRLMDVFTGKLKSAPAGVQRDRATEWAGMSAMSLLHEFVHAAEPEEPRQESYLLQRGMPLLDQMKVQQFDEAVVQAETLQIFKPWAENTGLVAGARGITESPMRSYSYSGQVAMLHRIMDATPVARGPHLKYLVGQGSGPAALDVVAAGLAGPSNPRIAPALARNVADEMFGLRVRWVKGQGGLAPDGSDAAARVIAYRDELRAFDSINISTGRPDDEGER